jgi:hypothetical protein
VEESQFLVRARWRRIIYVRPRKLRGEQLPGLIDFAPSADALLEIEPEDLGLILVCLAHKIWPPAQNFTLSHFETPLWNANSPAYPHHKRQAVTRAIAEAWQWL